MPDIFDQITSQGAPQGDIFDQVASGAGQASPVPSTATQGAQQGIPAQSGNNNFDIATAQFGGVASPAQPSVPSNPNALPQAVSQFARPLLEFGGAGLGAIKGGTAGGAVGGPIGAPIGAVGGSALGFATGSQIADRLDNFLGVANTNNQNIQSSQTPTITQARQVGKDLLFGASLEAGGQIGGKFVSSVVGKFISPLSKETSTVFGQTDRNIPEDTRQLINLYKEFNIKPSPAEIAHGSKTLGLFENVLGATPFSGDVILKKNIIKANRLLARRSELIAKGANPQTIERIGNNIRNEAKSVIEKFVGKNTEAVNDAVDKFMGQVGELSTSQSGIRFSEIANSTRRAMQDSINEQYTAASEALPQKGADVVNIDNNLIDTARRFLKIETSKIASTQDKSLIKLLNDFIPEDIVANHGFSEKVLARNPALREALNPAKQITWRGLDETRKALLEQVRSIINTEGRSTSKSRILSELANGIDNTLGSFADSVGGDAKTLLDTARASSRRLNELFNKDLLKIINKSPEDILGKIVNNGEVSLLNQIKEATGEAGLKPLRQGFFTKVMTKAMRGGKFNAKTLLSTLDNLGQETLDALATPEQIKALHDMASGAIKIDTRAGAMRTINFLSTLMGTSNERVVDAIFKKENTFLIRTAKRLLSPQRIDEITQAVLEQKILKVSATGDFKPVSSATEFFRHARELRTLMGKERFNALSDFIKLGQRMNRVELLANTANSNTGTILIGHSLLNQVINLGKGLVGSTFIPFLLSKGYVSDTAIKLLTSSAKLPANSPQALNLFTKGWTILFKDLQKESQARNNNVNPQQAQ